MFLTTIRVLLYLCLKAASFISHSLTKTHKNPCDFFWHGQTEALFRNSFFLFLCRWQGHKSKEPVGDERRCGHGCPATWMIFVQRGDEEVLTHESELKCKQCTCGWVIYSLMVNLPVFSVGGLWAVLSEAPAGRARGPSGRRGEGERRHRDPGLQTALRWGHLHWRGGEQWWKTWKKTFLAVLMWCSLPGGIELWTCCN